MKILIVTPIFPPEIGGPARYCSELVQRLPPSVNVRVVSFSNIGTKLSDARVVLVPTQGGVFLRQGWFLWVCLKYGWQSDLIYLQEPAVVGLVGLVAGKLLQKKIIVKYVGDPGWERKRMENEITSFLPDYLGERVKDPDWRYRITGFVLRSADKVVTPATHLQSLLGIYYFVDAKKIMVIPNSVEIKFQERIKKQNRLVVVGRLVSWKNTDLILEAFSMLKTKTSLVIIGDGPEKENLVKLAKDLKINSQVDFVGIKSSTETIQEIKKSKVLVLFSDYEGLPHVILEAMSVRTAVVASDINGIDEVITSGVTGFLIKNKDVMVLAKQIDKLLKDEKLSSKITNNAFQMVAKSYNWDKNLKKLLDLFHEVLEK